MLAIRLKGFTIIELMLTLALSSVLAGLIYLGYNYLEKLFLQFNKQSEFIAQVEELNKRFNTLADSQGVLMNSGNNAVIFKNGSTNYSVFFTGKNILFKTESVADTFKLENKDLKLGYEPLGIGFTANNLVGKVQFTVLFENEEFHLEYVKAYDAFSKLKYEYDELK